MINLIKEIDENIQTLKERYEITKEVVYSEQYADYWKAYDFNSGYFMALKVNHVNPETLRKHLIDHYSIGIIALNDTDIRMHLAVLKRRYSSCFESIAKAIDDLR